MSQRAVLLHIVGDMTKSIVVLIAALILYFFPHALFIDPISTFIFSGLVFAITLPIEKECLNILMEAPPPDFNTMEFTKQMNGLDSVKEIHDLHIWMLTADKTCMTAHLIAFDPTKALIDLTNLCE
jgi:zinc transporter 2